MRSLTKWSDVPPTVDEVATRGINHGLIAQDVCCCVWCDHGQTGASRVRPTGQQLAREVEGT